MATKQLSLTPWLDSKTKNLDGEVWKPVRGFKSYEVSNYKRVRSLPKVAQNLSFGGILKPHFDNNYWGVSIYKDGRRYYRKLHKLFAIAFMPNPQKKKYVNHKNGIKTDLADSNLEWATSSENQKHAYKIGLCKPKYHRRKSVVRINHDGTETKFLSTLLAAKSVSPNSLNGSYVISAIKKDKTYNNYKFKYA